MKVHSNEPMGRSSRHQTIPEESTSSAAASPRPSKHQYRKQVKVQIQNKLKQIQTNANKVSTSTISRCTIIIHFQRLGIYENFCPGLGKRTHLTNGNATLVETAASEQEHRLLQGHLAHQVQLKPESQNHNKTERQEKQQDTSPRVHNRTRQRVLRGVSLWALRRPDERRGVRGVNQTSV